MGGLDSVLARTQKKSSSIQKWPRTHLHLGSCRCFFGPWNQPPHLHQEGSWVVAVAVGVCWKKSLLICLLTNFTGNFVLVFCFPPTKFTIFVLIFFLLTTKGELQFVLSTVGMGRKDSSGTSSMHNFKLCLTLITFVTFSTTPSSLKFVLNIYIVTLCHDISYVAFFQLNLSLWRVTELESTALTSLDII